MTTSVIWSNVERNNCQSILFFQSSKFIHKELKLTHWILQLTIHKVIVNVTCLSVKNDNFNKLISDQLELLAVVTGLSKLFINLWVINPCLPPMSILICSGISFF